MGMNDQTFNVFTSCVPQLKTGWMAHCRIKRNCTIGNRCLLGDTLSETVVVVQHGYSLIPMRDSKRVTWLMVPELSWAVRIEPWQFEHVTAKVVRILVLACLTT